MNVALGSPDFAELRQTPPSFAGLHQSSHEGVHMLPVPPGISLTKACPVLRGTWAKLVRHAFSLPVMLFLSGQAFSLFDLTAVKSCLECYHAIGG